MQGNSLHGNQEIPVGHAAMRKRRAGRGTQKGTPFENAAGKSDHCAVCAEQRVDREGSSPSGARMRSAVSKSGGNSSLAGKSGRYGEA